MENSAVLIQEVLHGLKNFSSTGMSALVGLDGYIDKIQHPVQFQKRDGNVYFPTLSEFGRKITAAANQSAQIELYTQQTKLGGNAPIMSNALAALEVPNTCLGTLGYPDIHPIFRDINSRSELISVGQAAETNALEFNDGKMILSELSTFSTLDWEAVKQKIDLHYVRDRAKNAKLIALVDWCNLPHATSIWQGILDDVISKQKLDGRHFFFDLTDPSKKSGDEVRAVLQLMRDYQAYGSVTMGLNENETHKLFGLLTENDDERDLLAKGQYIFETTKIDRLVVHPIDQCIVFETGKTYSIKGRLVSKPKVTTGGGDNFNAGYSLGMLYGFPTEHCMVLAMATSGWYVTYGRSPEIKDVIGYLNDWLKKI